MTKMDDAISILKALGLPKGQQNERSALTLLALLDLKEGMPWMESRERNIRIHEILLFIKEHYNKQYAENTRETIRRQSIHQFEQAGIVIRNPDDLSRPTNSPNTVYSITKEALNAIRKYGSNEWSAELDIFFSVKGRLIDRYSKRKRNHQISFNLSDGSPIRLSPGKHNQLQADVISEFIPRFCPDTTVLYVGDTARKMLHIDEEILKRKKIPITKHDKLPDIVLYNSRKNILFLIEVVTSHGPLSPKRRIELEEVLSESDVKRVYISAFPDFKEFRKHIQDIAWDTEVWIRENPNHMIHFNGPKFFSIYDE